jgi:hypothetical protein
MQIAIKNSTVHLLLPDSTETAENVGNVFAHDVPLIHARRCKGVGWLIKIEHSKEKGGKTKTKLGVREREREGRTKPEDRNTKIPAKFLSFFRTPQQK